MIQSPKAPFVIVSLLIGLFLQACAPARADSTAFVSTPGEDKYAEAFITYAKQLEEEGLTAVKEIGVENSKPFIFILKSQEITDEDVKNATEIATRTVSVFESAGGLRHNDIDLAFRRPKQQQIFLIERPHTPELLSQGEVTISIEKTYFRSFVNLAGPMKNGSQEFANSWYIVQSICLAYTGNHEDSDAICNVASANASAAW